MDFQHQGMVSAWYMFAAGMLFCSAFVNIRYQTCDLAAQLYYSTMRQMPRSGLSNGLRVNSY